MNTTQISYFNCFRNNQTCEIFSESVGTSELSLMNNLESSVYFLSLPVDDTQLSTTFIKENTSNSTVSSTITSRTLQTTTTKTTTTSTSTTSTLTSTTTTSTSTSTSTSSTTLTSIIITSTTITLATTASTSISSTASTLTTTSTSTTSTTRSTTSTSSTMISTIATSTTTSTTSTKTSTTSTSRTSTTSTSTRTTTASCAFGYVATPSAACVNIENDFNNCGSIGYVCSSSYTICSAGMCKTGLAIQLSGAIPISAWVGVTTDDAIQQVSLSVKVTLYNYTTSSVTVSSNGLLCLGSCTNAYSNQYLPTTSVGGPTAFGFWDDLEIYSGIGQMVYYATSGTAPNRITTFEYYISYYASPSSYFHFQIIFYENLPNVVKYVYFEIFNGGSSATIGVQKSSSGPSITYSVNQAYAVAYNTTLIFDTNAGTYTRLG
ncbi:unnamed protein product [Adineta steineri]|uniref:Uncharacterized protein n=1 Tax=Adineta steineri TaxID=433720 RepID=A0A819EZ85_9BILA|nr:unnamed protein product [Adineta steineri]CAF3857936.1 unnamed protein product [Adineta steineri]